MLIGVLGYIGSGKGTVAEQLVNTYDFKQDSFAASLKDACAVIFNWDRAMLEGDTKESRAQREIVDEWWAKELGIENFTPRLALQLIGTDTLRTHFHKDIWLLTLRNRLAKNPDHNVVVSDVRFPNEIQLIRDLGGILVEVSRGDAPVWEKVALRANRGDEDAWRDMHENFPEVHYSEWAWVGSKVDRSIANNGTIESLHHKVSKLIS